MDTGTFRYKRKKICRQARWNHHYHGVEAAKIAVERAGITPRDIDFIIFATLSPDYYFRVVVFYSSVPWRWKRSGSISGINAVVLYMHFRSLIITLNQACTKTFWSLVKTFFRTRFFYPRKKHCRDIYDGAGAVVVQPTEKRRPGILSTHLHSDGERLKYWPCTIPAHANHWVQNPLLISMMQKWEIFLWVRTWLKKAQNFPNMDGPAVLKSSYQISWSCDGSFGEEQTQHNWYQPAHPTPGQSSHRPVCCSNS